MTNKLEKPTMRVGLLLTQCLAAIVFEKGQYKNSDGEIIYEYAERPLPPSVTVEDIVFVARGGGPVDSVMSQVLVDNFGGTQECWEKLSSDEILYDMQVEEEREEKLRREEQAETIKIYKIRNKKTGLFSTGGINPNWNKNGKNWKTLAHAKSSIRVATEYAERMLHRAEHHNWYSEHELAGARRHLKHVANDWEIVEITTKVSNTDVMSVGDIMEFDKLT